MNDDDDKMFIFASLYFETPLFHSIIYLFIFFVDVFLFTSF